MTIADLRSAVHRNAVTNGVTMRAIISNAGISERAFYYACKSPECVNITTATRLMKVLDAVAPEAEFLIMGALKLYSHKPQPALAASLNSQS